MHDKLAWLIKHVTFINWLYQKIMSLCFRLIGLFIPVDEKLVLLSSYGGDQYNDSPKVLFEAMKSDPRFKGFHYVWAFANPTAFDVPEAEKVKIDSLLYFKTALSAKIWITNVNIERGLHFKKKSQIYLNTWHGTGPKASGNAVKGRNDYDFSYVDIICVDGQHTRNQMINDYNAREENLLFSGRPREDELYTFNEETTKKIRNSLNISEEKKILLYMPTWREHGNLELSKDLWEKNLSDEFVMLVRTHHFVKTGPSISNNDFWIDVSDYPDVNELYWVSDVLISDYSSAFFDFGLLAKPMVCFAYDYDEFEKNPGLIMNLKKEFPSGIKSTEQEVIEFIKSMDFIEEGKKTKAYIDGYLSRPENSTKMCVDRIIDLLSNK